MVKRGIVGFLLLIGFFLCYAHLADVRLIAKDEGYYVMAARLVANGQLPYRDFFYPQAPYYPFILATWGWLLQDGAQLTLPHARLFAALCAALAGVLVVFVVYRRTNAVIGLLAGLVFLLSPTVFPWYAVALTYAPTALLVLSAIVLAEAARHREKPSLAALSGVSLGLAIGLRALVLPVVPLWLLYFWWPQSRSWRLLSWWCLGLTLALLPALILFIADPDNFLFGNYGYHTLRSKLAPGSELTAKGKVLAVVFGLRDTGKYEGLVPALVMWLACIPNARWSLVNGVAIILALVSLVPTPTYVQYFAQVFPFAVISAFTGWYALLQAVPRRRVAAVINILMPLLMFLELARTFPLDYTRYSQTGDGVIGLGKSHNMSNWRPSAIEEVGALINRLVPPDTPVLALWPGHLLTSHARPLPGFENHFGLLAATKIQDVKLRSRYHLQSNEDARRLIIEGKVSAVILDADSLRAKAERSMVAALAEGGYREVGGVEDVRLFMRGE